jgi:MinD-like ATPase involved in chromosome partitioning or flagellar assembly
MNNNQILAVWGSPGSGKTVTVIKIAKALESMKHSVAIVLCDDEIPMIPILLPNGKQHNYLSIGELLSQPRISQAEILKYSIPYGNDNISLLGYILEDNEMKYPEYSPSTAKSLLISLSRLVDNIIIDCSNHISSNVLSIVSLESADVVLRVVNASLKSYMYIRSQRQLLVDSRFHYEKYKTVLNNISPGQDDSTYSNLFGKTSYILPHCPTIIEQYETGKLTDSLFGREAKRYEPIINEIVKDVFIN